jgi:anti-anti-sigma factor
MTQFRPFTADVRTDDGAAIIDLHGEIDGLADAALAAAFGAAAGEQPARVLLYFGDVDYINSTGIALIVGVLAQARKAHISLVTYGLNDHYREIFQITRLADFMTMAEDEAGALGAG